jgi:hypothetical protein
MIAGSAKPNLQISAGQRAMRSAGHLGNSGQLPGTG